MKLIRGNIWQSKADGICVTTNGIIKKNGLAVMGRGIALQAAKRHPCLAQDLANALVQGGNKLYLFYKDPVIITFPTKNHWIDKSDIKLIEKSAVELVYNTKHLQRVALPFPGCANGGLNIKDVLSVINPILSDDKFEIWDYKVKE